MYKVARYTMDVADPWKHPLCIYYTTMEPYKSMNDSSRHQVG